MNIVPALVLSPVLGSCEPDLTTRRTGPQILPFRVKNGLSTMAAFVRAWSRAGLDGAAWDLSHGPAWGRQRGLSRNQAGGGGWKPHPGRMCAAGGSRPDWREEERKESERCDMFCSLVSTGGGREQKTNKWASPDNKVTQPQFLGRGPRSLEVECRCVALRAGWGLLLVPVHISEATWGGWQGGRQSSRRGGRDPLSSG